MMDTLNPLLQWLNAHPNWAGFATFIISCLESVAIIGTIVPGTIMMTAVGTLAGAGVIPLWLTIVCAIVGAVVGDGISYLIGFYFKDRLRTIWPFRNNPQWLSAGEQFFHKHGGKSVFIGRFVGPVRAIIPVIAGMLGMKPYKFYIANILSAIGWAPAYMLPGILLGAASLELPPDIAVHVILMFLLVSLFIIFCIWLVLKIFVLIGNRIEQFLSWIWSHLKNSRYAHIITIALKHHNPNKTHGQLVIAFYLTLVLLCFFYLAWDIKTNQSTSLLINDALFHFFRSLRSEITDNALFAITLMGDSSIIIPTFAIIFGWLLLTKRSYLAWHVFALGLLAVGSIEITKHIVHSPRPWGLLNPMSSFSFPSGHATLSTVFFIGLALLLIKAYPSKKRALILSAISIVLLVSLSRLYFGVHWFTDILAGWLLGAAILLLITISYYRKKDTTNNIDKIAISSLLIFLPLYLFVAFHQAGQFKQQYAMAEYPHYTIDQQAWWSQSDPRIPVYRVNRIGIATQHFNIQWLGSLDFIEKTLLKNGWETPPERNWISVIERIADVQSTGSLPIVAALHLDKKPVIVLVKHTEDDKRVMVLRLWNSNVTIEPKDQELWVGTITLIPRTYSWIFKKNSDEIEISSQLIFTKIPSQLEVKTVPLLPSKANRQKKIRYIFLMKPKT